MTKAFKKDSTLEEKNKRICFYESIVCPLNRYSPLQREGKENVEFLPLKKYPFAKKACSSVTPVAQEYGDARMRESAGRSKS